jgi:hypothetical protein
MGADPLGRQAHVPHGAGYCVERAAITRGQGPGHVGPRGALVLRRTCAIGMTNRKEAQNQDLGP